MPDAIFWQKQQACKPIHCPRPYDLMVAWGILWPLHDKHEYK
jgi:hypothetical protein